MTVFELTARLALPRPAAEVFAFFADAGNLELLTPPWLHIEIRTPRPIAMRPGALIDYRLRLRGLPVSWRTAITAWEPPRRFVDEQLRGPYRLWVHEHTFEEQPDGTTLAGDRVRYAVPGGRLVHRLLVARDIRTIFAYREARMRELFGGEQVAPLVIREVGREGEGARS
jgi:ligand-binding SRPBCC domain-containing protein